MTTEKKLNIQLILGVIISIIGLILLIISLFLPPIGIIDSSVLVAYGEVSTFAGALIGIDYTYKYKVYTKENG